MSRFALRELGARWRRSVALRRDASGTVSRPGPSRARGAPEGARPHHAIAPESRSRRGSYPVGAGDLLPDPRRFVASILFRRRQAIAERWQALIRVGVATTEDRVVHCSLTSMTRDGSPAPKSRSATSQRGTPYPARVRQRPIDRRQTKRQTQGLNGGPAPKS